MWWRSLSLVTTSFSNTSTIVAPVSCFALRPLLPAVSSLPVPRWLELGIYDDLALIINHLRNGSHPLTDPAWEIGGGSVHDSGTVEAGTNGAAAGAFCGDVNAGEADSGDLRTEGIGGSSSVVAAVGHDLDNVKPYHSASDNHDWRHHFGSFLVKSLHTLTLSLT